jgi:hypothetical protein
VAAILLGDISQFGSDHAAIGQGSIRAEPIASINLVVVDSDSANRCFDILAPLALGRFEFGNWVFVKQKWLKFYGGKS